MIGKTIRWHGRLCDGLYAYYVGEVVSLTPHGCYRVHNVRYVETGKPFFSGEQVVTLSQTTTQNAEKD